VKSVKRLSRKQETDHILKIQQTANEVTDILYKWPTDKIERFRVWLQENQNSENVPWEAVE
jgi:hypothetical protein